MNVTCPTFYLQYEQLGEKTNNLGYQVQQKLACTVTEAGQKPEISEIRRKGLYYLCSENKGADQLCSDCTVDVRLCYGICRFLVFSCGGSCL